MITLLTLYLIIGCVLSLIIWYTVFQPDFDEFTREELKAEPLTASQKITVCLVTPFIWPLSLYRMLS